MSVTDTASSIPRIGVSACLLGQAVRFDGQHKRDDFLNDVLAPFVTFVSVCPELEVGMGVPREPVRLVRGAHRRTLMLGTDSGADWTDRMNTFAVRRAQVLADDDLDGYVLKAKSPSCGMERTKLYDDVGPAARATRDGMGLFTLALRARLPNLPMEDEGRLHDARLRDNFIERVFAYARLRRLWRQSRSVGGLVAFHAAHKMQLLAHSTDAYRTLGRLVAGAKAIPRATLRARYEAGFMSGLATLATRGRHANVLMHMLGHLRAGLDQPSRDDLLGIIQDHRRGLVPLVVPVTLIRHHTRRQGVTYLLGQSYLEPHPKELMLRNHV